MLNCRQGAAEKRGGNGAWLEMAEHDPLLEPVEAKNAMFGQSVAIRGQGVETRGVLGKSNVAEEHGPLLSEPVGVDDKVVHAWSKV